MIGQAFSGLGSGLMDASIATAGWGGDSDAPAGFNMQSFMSQYAPEGTVWDEQTNTYIDDPGS